MTEEQKERLLEIACDLCWYPTVISNPEWLEEKCKNCPMERALNDIERG